MACAIEENLQKSLMSRLMKAEIQTVKNYVLIKIIATTMNDNERKSKSKYKKLNDTYDQQYIPGGGAENAEKMA